jgi:hypothetical protein
MIIFGGFPPPPASGASSFADLKRTSFKVSERERQQAIYGQRVEKKNISLERVERSHYLPLL